jgi:hypothetical protein
MRSCEMSDPTLIYSTATDDSMAAVFKNESGMFTVIAWTQTEDYEKDFLEETFENSEDAIEFAEKYIVTAESKSA